MNFKVRYSTNLAQNTRVLRIFDLPSLSYVVEDIESIVAIELPIAPPEKTVLFFPDHHFGRSDKFSVELVEFATVGWQYGKIEISTISSDTKDSMSSAVSAALVFDHLEREIRSLETALPKLEQQALADVLVAYRVQRRYRAQSDRLFSMMEQLSITRLTIAKLFPILEFLPDDLSPKAKKLLRRLMKCSLAESRLNILSDRYEALEDLYEGAVDRITDQRGWYTGHVLEVVIIVILISEFIFYILD